ncbi:hypothetical protein UFOVP40_38 [uncultured Caudovirales phage]|uniref:Uncharacterized protein n=1 Tax=uncultured Caudovirales phage TaxID=2100421 RepID=A0A6J5KNI9_9CAUD|nr:hypothetical protein UFOVP40_38 [uncultured Caudovirales phage]
MITVKNIIPRKQAENAQTSQYTAANCKTVIDKFTVTNTTAGAVVFSANLVPLAGAASAANCVLSAKSIAAGETYNCPELVGQSLEAGGFISTLAGAATSLTISATGREIT